MKKFKRRSFGSGSRLEQNHEEAPALDLSKDAAENMKELLQEITKKEVMSTVKRMGFLNNFSQFVRSVSPTVDFGLTMEEIAACLRISLISAAKEVRAAGFRAFRHLLSDEESLDAFLDQKIDVFICKSLDLPPAQEVERVQALRLVRKVVYLCPMKFPLSVAMSLASISCDSSQDKDRLSRACLATLCELAVQNTKIASYSGVIGAIIINTLDCSIPRMNESLISTILYLLNHPKYRSYVRRRVGLEPILAPFTDLYYTHNSEIQDNQIKEDRATRVESAKLAVVAVIRSWSGLVSFCDPDANSLESLLGVFALPSVPIRKAIIDTLFDIFCLRQPTITSNFNVALKSIDPSAAQESWKLTDLFLLAEADAVLPHRAQSTRANLIESYLSLLLVAFIEAGLLEKLVQVITTSDDIICISGSILLGEILHMANVLLPPSYSGHTHCLPTLISLATNLEKPPIERGKASAAVGYLDQIHHLKKRGAIPNTLFMEQMMNQVSKYNTQNSKSKSRQDKMEMHYIWREIDEVLAAIRETQVTLIPESDFQFWNWDLISTVLESSRMSIKRPDEPIFFRFIKRLTMFYKPTQTWYSAVKLSDPMARKYSEVALQLMDFLLRKDEQPDGERLLIEILQEVRDYLGEATQPGRVNGFFSTNNLSQTLTCDYFLLIGRLSSTTPGLRILDKTSGIFQYLMEICSMSSRESLIKLIISCLDYGRDGIARVLLSKTLSSASIGVRLYATKFLRVLLRVKCPYFSNWGIEFLTNQLYDLESELVETAIEILEEACEDEANLQRFIEVKPVLLHLGEKGIRLLSRYVSVTKGFTYLQEVNYLESLVQAWKTNYNREYVNWIELEIADSLSSFERQSANGSYIRRSSAKLIKRKDVYVLPHLYGELARHRHGIQLIEEQNLFEDCARIIFQNVTESSYDIFQLKAALWAVGHIMSSSIGINLSNSYKPPVTQKNAFSEETQVESEIATENQNGGENGVEDEGPDIIKIIVDMASNCEVLSIRGTCFYVIGLIASTSIGADKLEELGWDVVRHKGSEEWPVIEPDVTYIYEPDMSEEEQDSDSGDEADNSTAGGEQISFAQDRFGGIYLGEDVPEEDPTESSFQYIVENYDNNKKKKGKKSKQSHMNDESRFLREMSQQMTESVTESNMKMKFFDIDSHGSMYEKNESLLSGLDRLNHNRLSNLSTIDSGGIYLGDAESIQFSENRPPEYFADKSFEEFAPYLSGKSVDTLSAPPPYDDVKKIMKTKELYDEAGIYLGEEEIPDEHADTIEANLSPLTPSFQSPPFSLAPMSGSSSASTPPFQSNDQAPSRPFSVEASEPLKPIREEKSQESLDTKGGTEILNISVEEIEEEFQQSKNSYANDALDTTFNSEDRSSMQSPTLNNENNTSEDIRYRSVSLTDCGTKGPISRSPRSSSFSGTVAHNRLIARTSSQPRSGSDPGLGVVPSSLNGSVSSQESDTLRNENNISTKRTSSTKKNGRKKSRSENGEITEHARSNSILSDSGTPGVRLRITKRLRGGSTVSLGVSPKSARCLSTPSESPHSTYSREGAYGYTAWQTLKKQRSFRKELDSTLRKQTAISEKRRFTRSLAFQYRRLMESNGIRRSSAPVIPIHYSVPRKQLLSTSGTGEIIESYSASPEDYVGRSLPSNLHDFFRVKTYTYLGSWADNFVEFANENMMQSFDNDQKHVKGKCLYCQIKISTDEKPRSESDVSVRSKSHSSSKEDVDELDSEEISSKDEMSPKMKSNIKKEILRLVINLSSAVASKTTQQDIIALHGRHPWAFQDLCLYSQVSEVLGMFSFRLAIRRFIQKLFENVDFSLVFETADTILGRPSNYNEKKV